VTTIEVVQAGTETDAMKVEVILGPVDMIPRGEGRNFEHRGMLIAVLRSRSGGLFAVQATCPHRGGPLADGLVGGTILICPLHNWKFDLTTGAVLYGDCSITTYPARLDDNGHIRVTIDSP